MINSVVLVGRLTRDIDLKYTGQGTAVGNFTLAVNRAFKNANGEREADFINCVIWRKSAESMANFTRKGSLVGIEGSIQTRSYENAEGKKVYVTEINAEKFHLLDSKKDNPEENKTSGVKKEYPDFGKSDPFAKSSAPIDISDDDLPF